MNSVFTRFLCPFPPKENKELSRDPGARIQNNILPASGSGGNEALVPLVEAGHECRTEYRDVRPAWSPQGTGHCGQSCPPRSKKQNTQNAVTDNVSAFANQEVPGFKAHRIQAEKEMQQRIENPAGVGGREHGGGFKGDDNQPENRGRPHLQEIFLVRVQTRALLDGIVRSLSGDHDIMDVAFAESSAADAHESALLQQFGDGGAAAVSHT